MCKDCENSCDLSFDPAKMMYHILVDITELFLNHYENNPAL